MMDNKEPEQAGAEVAGRGSAAKPAGADPSQTAVMARAADPAATMAFPRGGHAAGRCSSAGAAKETAAAPAHGAADGTGTAEAEAEPRWEPADLPGTADPSATALFVSAFFDELMRGGVRDVVVSPGSRSTPLAMVAYEASRRFPDRLRLYVDVDERSAAFFALGMAKASGHPACLVCTSGTAVANYYPAILEAEASRVPLIVLTADRPARLQGLGAPQTCDQLKAYGSHVRLFRQMPEPAPGDAAAAFARQAAREALVQAGGLAGPCSNKALSVQRGVAVDAGHTGWPEPDPFGGTAADGWPVHLNFPFDEPLVPNLAVDGLFETGRSVAEALDVPCIRTWTSLGDESGRIGSLLRGKRVLVLAGEGSARTEAEARCLIRWARSQHLPVLADPLSGLRCFDDSLVLDNYDNVFARKDCPMPDAVVRFGRYPVSKRCSQRLAEARPLQIVVDPCETRDFACATDVFVPCTPYEFVRSVKFESIDSGGQRTFFRSWVTANDAERARICAVEEDLPGMEGAYVRALLELAPERSLVFAANSLSIRAIDTFQVKQRKRLRVLCNRGLNGIDGTVSAGIGAAQGYGQTTLLVGDVALLHDLNALALQRELRLQRERAAAVGDEAAPCIAIVLLNNNGGAIFDMLPQQSDDPYFERLFLTPHDVNFEDAAFAFDVPYRAVGSVGGFREAYRDVLGTPGITLIEAKVPLRGVADRYGMYW